MYSTCRRRTRCTVRLEIKLIKERCRVNRLLHVSQMRNIVGNTPTNKGGLAEMRQRDDLDLNNLTSGQMMSQGSLSYQGSLKVSKITEFFLLFFFLILMFNLSQCHCLVRRPRDQHLQKLAKMGQFIQILTSG